MIGHVERWQEVDRHRFISVARQAANIPFLLLGEIHVDQTFVNLDDTVLQSAGDAEFLFFHGQNQRRLRFARDLDPVEFHEAAQRRHDQRAGAGHSDLSRNVRLIANGEVALVKRQLVGLTVLNKAFDGGFDQPNAAVVAVEFYILRQVVDGTEPRAVILGEHDVHGIPLIQHSLRPEVAHNQRDRLAVITVGRITEESGSGEGAFTNDEHAATSPDAFVGQDLAFHRPAQTPRRHESKPGNSRYRTFVRRCADGCRTLCRPRES